MSARIDLDGLERMAADASVKPGPLMSLRCELADAILQLVTLVRELEAIANAAESYFESEGGPGDDDARLHLCTLLANREVAP